MGLFLLDTTVLIDHLRGRAVTGRIESLRRRGDGLSTSAINIEEVVRGLKPAEQPVADRLIGALVVIAVREHEARQAGEWRRAFAEEGVTLSQADCLIAACARSMDATLATGNPRHFPMSDITVAHWPVAT